MKFESLGRSHRVQRHGGHFVHLQQFPRQRHASSGDCRSHAGLILEPTVTVPVHLSLAMLLFLNCHNLAGRALHCQLPAHPERSYGIVVRERSLNMVAVTD